ncbi:MAG: serine/threonine protein kinase [Anaerolineae bacterium]|nr:serine/threonine protein kinase [Anaerolineae bacterium]
MGHEPAHEPELEPEEIDEAASSSAPSDDDDLSLAALLAPAPSTGASLIGQTLEGRYRFDELLGEGSFARVFKVYDLHRQVYLAAKVLRSDIAQEPAFLERFKREASVLARLQHPNIVRYYETVESGDVVFILTDYIAGRTLQAVLREQGGPISPFESLTYLRPMAAALHYAHRENIVHRDLKPANILLDENNHLYVTDFGIARIISDTSTLTMDTTVGTPHFMSPEQIMLGEITGRTDIYAFGVLLYQMYTGQLPFVGDSPEATGTMATMRIVYEHLHVKPEPLSDLNPRISRAVENVVLKCLEKDPAQRYRTMNEVFAALSDAIGTPSVSFDADEIAGVAAAGSLAGERVPTAVGGLSQVIGGAMSDSADRYDDDYADEYADEYSESKSKRAERKAKRFGEWPEDEVAEAMTEKEREKKQESEEKNDEKQQEKGWDTGIEKHELFVDIGPSDRLSQFTFGAFIVWIGIVLGLNFSEGWSWIVGGAGSLLILEAFARVVMPEFRARPGGRLVIGSVLLMLGFGGILGFGTFWPLILIVIGASLLINRLFD